MIRFISTIDIQQSTLACRYWWNSLENSELINFVIPTTFLVWLISLYFYTAPEKKSPGLSNWFILFAIEPSRPEDSCKILLQPRGLRGCWCTRLHVLATLLRSIYHCGLVPYFSPNVCGTSVISPCVINLSVETYSVNIFSVWAQTITSHWPTNRKAR